MRLIQIQAARAEDRECLVRELAAYAPTRLEGSVVIELGDRSQKDFLALMTAIEKCLVANDIGSVSIELDGESYLFASQ